MPTWVDKAEDFCEVECNDPCAVDCCCEFIGFRVCSALLPCDEELPCKPPHCIAWNVVNLFWNPPPRCVRERAAAFGEEDAFRYEIYFGGCGEIPDRIISAPVSGTGPSCPESGASVSRCELLGLGGGACGECVPAVFCLVVRATTGEEIARCKACIDLCDEPCSSSSGSSGSGGGDGGGPSSSSSSGSSLVWWPPGDGPSSSSGSGGGTSSSRSSSSSSGSGYVPPGGGPSSGSSSSSSSGSDGVIVIG